MGRRCQAKYFARVRIIDFSVTHTSKSVKLPMITLGSMCMERASSTPVSNLQSQTTLVLLPMSNFSQSWFVRVTIVGMLFSVVDALTTKKDRKSPNLSCHIFS